MYETHAILLLRSACYHYQICQAKKTTIYFFIKQVRHGDDLNKQQLYTMNL